MGVKWELGNLLAIFFWMSVCELRRERDGQREMAWYLLRLVAERESVGIDAVSE